MRGHIWGAVVLAACTAGSVGRRAVEEPDGGNNGAAQTAGDSAWSPPTSDGGSGSDAFSGSVDGSGMGGINSDASSLPADAAASAGDGATTPQDGAAGGEDGSTLPPPAGSQPAFVAVGYSARRVVSWDFGQTWEVDVQGQGTGETGMGRGIAYGNGAFVISAGMGGQRMLIRVDSASSSDLCLVMPIDDNGNAYNDVAFGNGRFVAGGGHRSRTSLDGMVWDSQEGIMEAPSGSAPHLRRIAGGDYAGGRFVAVGNNGRRMASADGVVWDWEVTEGSDLNWIAYGAGTFLAITEGSAATRYSTDGGESWQSGSLPAGANARGLLYDGVRFIVTTDGDTFTSADGLQWERHAADGGPNTLAVNADRTHYAGARGNVLYHSTDGVRFEPTKSSGEAIVEIAFGHLRRVDSCPAGAAQWN